MTIVYHGTYKKIESPKILKSKFTKDFGEGFYCTLLFEQAVKWANRNEIAIVNHYIYTKNANLKYLIFEEMTDEWLDFIVDCRNGISHNYDIVSGPMADDQIYNYIADYLDKKINKEQFWVLAKFKYPTHQIVFCTEKSINCLQFIKEEDVSIEL